MERQKYVDESWKESAAQEKERLENITRPGAGGKASSRPEDPGVAPQETPGAGRGRGAGSEPADSGRGRVPAASATEEDFINYITSLAYQAMIFLGEIPNPVTSETEQNIQQAKFVIDTLILLQEKTQGNLTPKENDVLNTAAYELQMKYVEATSAHKGSPP